MVPVPGGHGHRRRASRVRVEPFFIGRTEVTWDMYDVFALRPGRAARAADGADAIARPSQPYGAPDYGWGHAGFPAISVARRRPQAFCAWLSTKTGKAIVCRPKPSGHTRPRSRPARTPLTPRAATRSPGTGATRRRGRTRSARSRPTRSGCSTCSATPRSGSRRPAGGALVTRGGSFRDAAEAHRTGIARAVQDESWNERDPQLPKSRWWLSDGLSSGSGW